jgi:hypothetical protein
MNSTMPSTRYQHTVDEACDTQHADEFDDDIDIGSSPAHASRSLGRASADHASLPTPRLQLTAATSPGARVATTSLHS